MNKTIPAIFLSASLVTIAIIVRLESYSMAWPSTWSYSGAREHTEWAIHEAALNDVAMMLFFLGSLIMAVAFHAHLTQTADKKAIKQRHQ